MSTDGNGSTEAVTVKRTYHINQEAVAALGLLWEFKPEHAMLLDWIRGWWAYPNAAKIYEGGNTFIWIDYKTAVEQNPMIFPPGGALKTRINRMTSMTGDLARFGIILKKKSRTGRLYIALTAKAHDLELAKVAAVPKPRDTAIPKIRESGNKEEEKVIEPPSLHAHESVGVSVQESEFVEKFWKRICNLFPLESGRSHRPPTKEDKRAILEVHRYDPITDAEIKEVEWFYRESRTKAREGYDAYRIGFWADKLPKSPASLARKWGEIHSTANQYWRAYSAR